MELRCVSTNNNLSCFLSYESQLFAVGSIGSVYVNDLVESSNITHSEMGLPVAINLTPAHAYGTPAAVILDESGQVWSFPLISVISKVEKTTKVPTPEIKSISICKSSMRVFCLDIEGKVWKFRTFHNQRVKQVRNLTPIKEIMAGSRFCLFLDEIGCVYSQGKGYYGTLGLGNVNYQIHPKKIENLPPIIAIATFSIHSLFLDLDGCVWGCGDTPNHGCLGFKPKEIGVPEKVPNIPTIIAISAGRYYSLFLDIDGNVWACGRNDHYQCGKRKNNNQLHIIRGLPPILGIKATIKSSFFADQEGKVWACGCNKYNQFSSQKKSHFGKPIILEMIPPVLMQEMRRPVKSARV